MTTTELPRAAARDWAGLALLGALGAAVAARWAATQAGLGDALAIGLAFGVALLAVAAAEGRPRSGSGWWAGGSPGTSVALGLAAGAGLIGLALLGRAVAGVPPAPSLIRGDAFVPWSAATLVVAAGEEALLRGALFRRVSLASGTWTAVAVTSLAFAVMHVPFYGWGVVPLDLGVGILLAGLRLWSGGILAPAIAHAIADLATWWL